LLFRGGCTPVFLEDDEVLEVECAGVEALDVPIVLMGEVFFTLFLFLDRLLIFLLSFFAPLHKKNQAEKCARNINEMQQRVVSVFGAVLVNDRLKEEFQIPHRKNTVRAVDATH